MSKPPEDRAPRDEELVLYYYGESRRRDEVRGRLERAGEAHARYEELCRVLAAVEAAPVPEPDARYGERVWNRLAAEIADEDGRSWWKRLSRRLSAAVAPPRLAAAGAVAALVALAFLAGRYWPWTEPAAELAPVSEEARAHIVRNVVADHLERSERLLLELANAPGGDAMDVAAERESAESLLEANRLYRQTTRRSGEVDLALVLDELERLLLDLAHGPEEIPAADLESYRARIDDVLFKVQVLNWRLRRQQRQPAPSANGDEI